MATSLSELVIEATLFYIITEQNQRCALAWRQLAMHRWVVLIMLQN